MLNALEGVAYLTGRNGVVLSVGQPGWQLSADGYDAPYLTAAAVIGRSIFDMMDGDEVRAASRAMHEALWVGRRTQVIFDYRCDAPAAERHMRMSISAVIGDNVVEAILYQSQLLAEMPRLPMKLFSSGYRGASAQAPDSEALVRLCSYCHDVAWMAGTDGQPEEWIPPEEYYRRGGGACIVSHGICPDCAERVVRLNT